MYGLHGKQVCLFVQASVFVQIRRSKSAGHGMPFQPSLIFVGKTRSMPKRGVPERYLEKSAWKVLHTGSLRPYSETLD
jgi:hypothetical protein